MNEDEDWQVAYIKALDERDAALARAEAAEAEVARLTEALLDAAAHLIGAASAYEKHASRNTHLRPRGIADPFYQIRVKDFREASDRARAALQPKEQ